MPLFTSIRLPFSDYCTPPPSIMLRLSLLLCLLSCTVNGASLWNAYFFGNIPVKQQQQQQEEVLAAAQTMMLMDLSEHGVPVLEEDIKPIEAVEPSTPPSALPMTKPIPDWHQFITPGVDPLTALEDSTPVDPAISFSDYAGLLEAAQRNFELLKVVEVVEALSRELSMRPFYEEYELDGEAVDAAENTGSEAGSSHPINPLKLIPTDSSDESDSNDFDSSEEYTIIN